MVNLVKDEFAYNAASTGNWSDTGTITWTTPGQVSIAGTTGVITNTTDTVTDLGNTTHEFTFQSDASGAAVVCKYEVYDGAYALVVILNQDATTSINGTASAASAYNYTASTDIKVRVTIDDYSVVKVYVDDSPTAVQIGSLEPDTTTAVSIKFSSTTTSINNVIKRLHIVDQIVELPDVVNDYTHYFSAKDVRQTGYFREKETIGGEHTDASTSDISIKTNKVDEVITLNKYTTTSSTSLKQVPSSPSTGEFSFFPPNMIRLGDAATSSDTFVVEFESKFETDEIDRCRRWDIQPKLNSHYNILTGNGITSSSDIPDQYVGVGATGCAIKLMMMANPTSDYWRNLWRSWNQELEDLTTITINGEEVSHTPASIITHIPWQKNILTEHRTRRNYYGGG